MQVWGWRIPFLLAFGTALLGYWMRLGMPEPKAFLAAARAEKEADTKVAMVRAVPSVPSSATSPPHPPPRGERSRRGMGCATVPCIRDAEAIRGSTSRRRPPTLLCPSTHTNPLLPLPHPKHRPRALPASLRRAAWPPSRTAPARAPPWPAPTTFLPWPRRPLMPRRRRAC